MYTLLCLLLPSAIGVKLITLFSKNKKNISVVAEYIMMLFLTNFLTLAYFNTTGILTAEIELLLDNTGFALKYIVLSIFVSAILGLLISYISQNVSLRLNLKKGNE